MLLCIANDPDVRLWEIGNAIGITERAAHRIVGELVASGYVSRERNGRRNRYAIEEHLPVPDPLARSLKINELLDVLTGGRPPDAQGTAST